MDIEKPAAPAARAPKHPAAAEKPPKSRDSLDALLDSESKDTGGGRKSSDGGLGKVLAIGGDSGSSAAQASAPQQQNAAPKSKGKHAARRSR
jgi:hypothetical protein